MRVRFAVLVAVTSVLTVVSPAFAGHSSASPRIGAHSASSDWAYVQSMLFGSSMQEFLSAARTADPWFDWSTDYCSAPLVGSTGLSFDFRNACRRHDFGYRNLHLLERRYGRGATYWNATNRKAVDERLLADMRAHCRTRAFTLQPSCFNWAITFYVAVRVAGGP